MLKRIIEEPESKALLILPYVALVQEKVRWLRTVVQGLAPNIDPEALEKQKANSIWRLRPDHDSLKVVGFFGGGKIRSTWQDFDIGICTLEKVCFALPDLVSCIPWYLIGLYTLGEHAHQYRH